MTVLDDTPTSVEGARGTPVGTMSGRPVYRSGQAPAHLRSRSQLYTGLRLTLGPGQRPVCYVIPTWHPDERRALYDPADAIPAGDQSIGAIWAWRQRRTCPRCGRQREYVVHGTQCGLCHREDRERAEEVSRRTCSGCSSGSPAAGLNRA